MKITNMAINSILKTIIIKKNFKNILTKIDKFKYLKVIINNEGRLEDKINKIIIKTGRLYNSIKSNFLNKKEMPKK